LSPLFNLRYDFCPYRRTVMPCRAALSDSRTDERVPGIAFIAFWRSRVCPRTPQSLSPVFQSQHLVCRSDKIKSLARHSPHSLSHTGSHCSHRAPCASTARCGPAHPHRPASATTLLAHQRSGSGGTQPRGASLPPGLLVLNVLSAPRVRKNRAAEGSSPASGVRPRGVIVGDLATDNDAKFVLRAAGRPGRGRSRPGSLVIWKEAMVGRAFDQLEPRAMSCC